MLTIRQLIDKLESHIQDLTSENLEEDITFANTIITDILNNIDIVEQNNNEIKAIAEDLKKSDKMRDLADEILEPSEIIGKIVY